MKNSYIKLIIVIIVALAFGSYVNADQSCWNDRDDERKGVPMVCNKNENGCIKGIYKPGFRTKYYEAFVGIPYAEPPINKLRFANPVPVDTWETTIIADTEKEMCLQKNILIPGEPISGSDCLYLNVYRPKNAEQNRKPLPVIAYLHGGAFLSGAAGPSFVGAQYFMDTAEVILVTIAYRLGPFGFLSTGDKNMPGNFGFKDQAMALKWINKNIKYFNGNPDLVTLFGHSAGGAAVNLHTISNLSKGLFHRVGFLSGAIPAPYVEPERHPLELARKQAKFVGISDYETLPTKQLAKELRKADAYDIVNSVDAFRRFSIYPLVIFKIVLEDPDDPEAFITKHPKVLLENGDAYYVPLLTSIVDNEGFPGVPQILTNRTFLNIVNENLLELLPYILGANEDPPRIKSRRIIEIIRHYLDGRITLDEENKFGLERAFGDYWFIDPLYRSIKYFTKYMPPNNPVNLIKFSFKGRYSYSTVFSSSTKDFGVVHLDDCIYYFNSPALFPALEIDSPEAKASELLVNTFVKFAKTGVPEKWVPIDNCKYDRAESKKFCDYQHIYRAGNDVRVKLDNEFDYKMLSIWD